MALGCTVSELLSRISSRELGEWWSYYRVEPWGQEPAMLRAALIASTTANCASTKRHRLQDFILRFDGPREQPWQASQAYFMALSKRANG